MRKIVLTLALFSLVFSISVSAQWVQTGGPEGGYAQTLLRADNGDIIAAANLGGIYKSTDNGNSWFPSNSGLIQDGKGFTKIVTLKKGLSGKFFIYALYGNDKRTFVSSDNGNNWTMLPPQVWGSGTTNSTPDGTLYQILNNELAKSIDNGTTWTFPANSGLPKETISDFVPVSNTEMYVVFPEGKGVYKTADGGNNWSKLATQPISVVSIQLFENKGILYLLSGTTIQTSSNQGQTWAYSYNPPTFPLEPMAITAADNGDIYFTGRFGGLMKSTDRGTTWNSFFSGLDITGLNLSIVTTGSNEVIVCQYGFGLFKSPQSTAAFAVSHSGFNASLVYQLFEGTNGTFYTATDGSAYSSSDKGKTWTKLIDYGLNHASICENGNAIFIGRNDGVMRSINGGNTWAYVKNGFSIGTQQYVHQLVVTPKGTILAASGGGLFRTTNNGDVWARIETLGNKKVRSVILRANGELYASATSNLFKSVDDGASWTQVPLGKLNDPETDLDGKIEVIDFVEDSKNNLYLNFGASYYLKSTDKGITWNKVTIPTNGLITNIRSILFGQNDSLFVATNHHVVASSDFGVTFTEISNGLISRELQGLAKTANGDIYLLTSGSGLMKHGVVSTLANRILAFPHHEAIGKVYPNPFRSEANIEYRVEKPGIVTVKLYTIAGTEVAIPVNEYHLPGTYTATLNTLDLRMKNGVYLCNFNLNGKSSTIKLYYNSELKP